MVFWWSLAGIAVSFGIDLVQAVFRRVGRYDMVGDRDACLKGVQDTFLSGRITSVASGKLKIDLCERTRTVKPFRFFSLAQSCTLPSNWKSPKEGSWVPGKSGFEQITRGSYHLVMCGKHALGKPTFHIWEMPSFGLNDVGVDSLTHWLLADIFKRAGVRPSLRDVFGACFHIRRPSAGVLICCVDVGRAPPPLAPSPNKPWILNVRSGGWSIFFFICVAHGRPGNERAGRHGSSRNPNAWSRNTDGIITRTGSEHAPDRRGLERLGQDRGGRDRNRRPRPGRGRKERDRTPQRRQLRRGKPQRPLRRRVRGSRWPSGKVR